MSEEYIKTEELREMQLKILDIAKKISKICEEEKLKLYMLGGTFLGAIRHKGFIPWDDDMDFAMTREDYNKFLKIIENKLPSNLKLLHYSNVSQENRDKIKFHYIKIINLDYEIIEKIGEGKYETRNLFIDIFPLDNIPNNIILKGMYKMKLLLQRQQMRLARLDVVYSDGNFTGTNKIKRICYKINEKLKLSKKYNYFDTIVKFEKQMSKYSNQKNTKMISNILGGNGIFKETFPRKYFNDYELYTFEDTELMGAKEYDAILTQMYSDYMTLPKEENRVCKHCLQIKKVN